MNTKDADRLDQLAVRCELMLADKARQYCDMFRPDMRAILAMKAELARLQRKAEGK